MGTPEDEPEPRKTSWDVLRALAVEEAIMATPRVVIPRPPPLAPPNPLSETPGVVALMAAKKREARAGNGGHVRHE